MRTLPKLFAGLTAAGLLTAAVALAGFPTLPAVASVPAAPAAADASPIESPAVDMHDWLATRRPPTPPNRPPTPPNDPPRPITPGRP